MARILVLAETMQGKLRRHSLSAITFARQLEKRVGGGYSIALIGKDMDDIAQEVASYGAERVLVVDGGEFEHYLARPFARAVCQLVEKTGADFVAATSSTFSRDLLPRVAARLGAGMVSEVMAIVSDGDTLRYKRPMYAGNVIATVEVRTPKGVFTVRGTEFDMAEKSGSQSPIERIEVEITGESKETFVNFAATASERPDLTEAEIVVSGGRGLKDRDNFFRLLDPLADLLGAAIGGTRAVVDAGMVPNDLQIGQTGKVVAPKLYIAVALSGAIQHIAGMKNSKVIVAINKDPEAPIFQVADYGLVADAFKAVPELVERLKKVKGAA